MENQEQKASLEGDLLVVDDTLANLRLLTEMLQELGFKVRGARNGPTALSAAFTVPPARHQHARNERLRGLPATQGR